MANLPPDESSIRQIVEMGFPRDAAIEALKHTKNNIENAIDYIFNPPPPTNTVNMVDLANTPSPEDHSGAVTNDPELQRALQESLSMHNLDVSATRVEVDEQELHSKKEAQDDGVFSVGPAGVTYLEPDYSRNQPPYQGFGGAGSAAALAYRPPPPPPPASPGVAVESAPPPPPPRTAVPPYTYNPPTSVNTSFSQPNSNPKFGPATRDYYEESQWGLVPTAANSADHDAGTVYSVLPDAPPRTFLSEPPRVRRSDEFPLLIPNADGVYVAPLLTILHKIPLARRALLCDFHDIVPNYGFDKDWWKGGAIDMKPLLQGNDLAYSPEALLMIEIQRLVAFLDGHSRRPFASISNLTRKIFFDSVPTLRGETSATALDNHPVGQLLFDVLKYGEKQPLIPATFATTATREQVNSFDSEIKQGSKDSEAALQSYTNFTIDVATALASDTLYDLVDDVIWGVTEPPSAYFSNVSDVITFTLSREDGKVGSNIDIPLVFHPDRYTKPLIPYMRRIFELSRKSRDAISALTRRKFETAAFGTRDTSKVLSVTAKYLRDLEQRQQDGQVVSAIVDGKDVDLTFDLAGLGEALVDVEKASSEVEAKKQAIVEETLYHQNLIKLQKTLFKGNEDKEALKIVLGSSSGNSSADQGLPFNSSSTSLLTNVATPAPSDVSLISVEDEEPELSLDPPELRTFRLSGIILGPTEYFFCVKNRHAEEIPDLIMMDEDEEEDEDVEDLNDLGRQEDKALIDIHDSYDDDDKMKDTPMKDVSVAVDGLSTPAIGQGVVDTPLPAHHVDDLMHMDDSGAESAASTAAVSTDSAQTAVSLSQNEYEWYKVAPSGHAVDLSAVPEVTRVSVPEMLEAAKQGSRQSGSQGIILVYATETNAWAENVQGNYELPKGLAQFLEKDKRALVHLLQAPAGAQAAESHEAEPSPRTHNLTPSGSSSSETYGTASSSPKGPREEDNGGEKSDLIEMEEDKGAVEHVEDGSNNPFKD